MHAIFRLFRIVCCLIFLIVALTSLVLLLSPKLFFEFLNFPYAHTIKPVVVILYCLSVFGVLFMLYARNKDARRTKKSIVLEYSNKGSITLTEQALSSFVTKQLACFDSIEVNKIRIVKNNRSQIGLALELRNRSSGNLLDLGSTIQNDVLVKLNELCPDVVEQVDVQFLPAQDFEVE